MSHEPSAPSQVVARGYDAVAEAYRALESPDATWPRMRWLEDPLGRLSPGSRVLDLGCATGEPVAVRVARDHRITGVDLSTVQIEQARRLIPAGTHICADVVETSFPASKRSSPSTPSITCPDGTMPPSSVGFTIGSPMGA
jgi:predicted TPR repeat methyltransferase